MFHIVNLNDLTVSNLVKLADELGIKLKGKLKSDKINEIQNAGIEEETLQTLYNKYSKKKKTVSKKKVTTSRSASLSNRVEILERQVNSLIGKINKFESILSKWNADNSKTILSEEKVSQEHFLRIIRNVYGSIRKRSGGFVLISELTKGIKDYIPWTTKRIHKEIYKLFSEYKIELQPGKIKEGEPLEQDGQKFVWFKFR